MNKAFPFIGAIILLLQIGCASAPKTGAKTIETLKQHVRTKEYKQAIALVDSKKYFPEERSRLLKLIEKGVLFHLTKQYWQAVETFGQAKDLSEKLYTVSIKKKLLTITSDDTADNYYGEIYERSLIRFYLALDNYLLYQAGTKEPVEIKEEIMQDGKPKTISKIIPKRKLTKAEKRQFLFASRAIISGWDTLLNDWKGEAKGRPVYKDDMSAKIFGAFIHEQIGTRGDKQIARQLYKDARDLLYKNYNAYPALNQKYKLFIDDFSKLPSMKKEDIQKTYIAQTQYAKDLASYLDGKNKKKKKRRKNRSNVAFLLHDGFIASRVAKKQEYKIPAAAITFSAIGTRGMSPARFVATLLTGASLGGGNAIEFELPMIQRKSINYDDIKLVIKDTKGKEIKSARPILLNPLSDLAYYALEDKKIATYSKIGARVAAKHIAAIAGLYVTYKAAERAGGLAASFALPTAVISYAGASKAIAMKEKADIRAWSLLPHSIKYIDLQLAPGKYKLYIKRAKNEQFVQDITINKSKTAQLIDISLR